MTTRSLAYGLRSFRPTNKTLPRIPLFAPVRDGLDSFLVSCFWFCVDVEVEFAFGGDVKIGAGARRRSGVKLSLISFPEVIFYCSFAAAAVILFSMTLS